VGIGLVHFGDRVENPEARAHRTLGIVLVRDGRAEGSHHRVTDEFLDRAAVALDLLPEARMVWTEAGTHVFRILLVRGCGEADQVAEEHGDHLPLLERERRLSDKRRGAEAAESKPVWVLLSARGAAGHLPSLCRVTGTE